MAANVETPIPPGSAAASRAGSSPSTTSGSGSSTSSPPASSSSPGADGRPAADAAVAGRQRLPDARLLQRGHDHARDDDGLSRRRADPGRLRQLPRPADDRRARHGVPAAERTLVLALPVRRDHPAALVLRRRRSGQVWLDGLPPLSLQSEGNGQDALDPRPAHPHALVARGRDQLHRHDREHAHAGDELDADAALHLGDRHVRRAAARGAAGALGGADAAAARPPGGDELLRRTRAATPSSTSTSSGSSGTPRSTSWSCPPSG